MGYKAAVVGCTPLQRLQIQNMKILGIACFIVSTLLVWPALAGTQATSGQAAPPESRQGTAEAALADVTMVRGPVVEEFNNATDPPATLSFNNSDIVEFRVRRALGRTTDSQRNRRTRVLDDLAGFWRWSVLVARALVEVGRQPTLDLFALSPSDVLAGETLVSPRVGRLRPCRSSRTRPSELRNSWLVVLGIGWSLLGDRSPRPAAPTAEARHQVLRCRGWWMAAERLFR